MASGVGGTWPSHGDREAEPAAVGRPAGPSGTGPGVSRERHTLVLRTAIVAALVVAAYQYSLSTLLGDLGQQTPLAYLGLVPLLSVLLMAGLLYLPGRSHVDIHDRYLDYMVGLPLLGVALLIDTLGPARLSTFFWLWRLDLVSFPLFVAGAIALVFGTRMLWRLRLPVAFLLLAWPPIYTVFLNGLLNGVTNVTLGALHALMHVLPVATPLTWGDGSLFQINHGTSSFVLSVASACSGIDSVLGFLLVGAAAMALVRGPRHLKLLWLAAGIALIWSLDVVRLLLIFVTGRAWGQGFAIDVLHPFVGLLFFCLGVLAMILLVPRFRLELLGLGGRPGEAPPAAPREDPRVRRPAVRRARAPIAILIAAAAVAAVADTQMGVFELLAQNLGPPRVQPLTLANARISGWALTFVTTYPSAKLEFGSDSSWDRYLYLPPSPDLSPVTLDVISTPDLSTFGTYTVEDCYHFHDYPVLGLATVTLGGGLIGHTVVYQVNPHESWTAVYWEWPVTAGSGQTYQRVVLNELTVSSAAASERELTGFARRVIAATAHQVGGATST